VCVCVCVCVLRYPSSLDQACRIGWWSGPRERWGYRRRERNWETLCQLFIDW